MDGWPQEISEHNDQSLMNAPNINDDTQLKGFLSVGTSEKKKKSPAACAMREVCRFLVHVASISKFPVVKQSQQ